MKGGRKSRVENFSNVLKNWQKKKKQQDCGEDVRRWKKNPCGRGEGFQWNSGLEDRRGEGVRREVVARFLKGEKKGRPPKKKTRMSAPAGISQTKPGGKGSGDGGSSPEKGENKGQDQKRN